MIAISVESSNKLAIEQDTRTKPVGHEVVVWVRRGRICGSDIQIFKDWLCADPRRPVPNN